MEILERIVITSSIGGSTLNPYLGIMISLTHFIFKLNLICFIIQNIYKGLSYMTGSIYR